MQQSSAAWASEKCCGEFRMTLLVGVKGVPDLEMVVTRAL